MGSGKFHYGWLIVVGGLCCTAAMMFAIQLVPLQLGFISESLNLDNTSSSFIISVYGFTSGGAAFIWGFLADRFGPRKISAFAALIIGVFSICFGFLTDSFIKAVVFYGIVGFGAAGVFNATLSKIVGAWFYPDKRGRAMSLITPGSVIMGMVLGATIPSISSALGWQQTSVCMGLVVVILAALIFIILRDSPKDKNLEPIGTPAIETAEPPVKGRYLRIFAMPITWHLGIMYIFWQAGYLVISGFMAMSMIDAGAAAAVAGLAVSTYSLGQLIGQQIWGPLSDRFQRKHIVACAAALWSLCAIGFFFFYGNVVLMFAMVVLMGLGLGMVPVISAMMADYYPAGLRGSGSGVICTLGMIGRTVGPVLGGIVADAIGSLGGAFLFAAVMMLISMAITLTLPKPVAKAIDFRKNPDGLEANGEAEAKADADADAAAVAEAPADAEAEDAEPKAAAPK